MTMTNIVAGFRTTGVFPLNRMAISGVSGAGVESSTQQGRRLSLAEVLDFSLFLSIQNRKLSPSKHLHLTPKRCYCTRVPLTKVCEHCSATFGNLYVPVEMYLPQKRADL